MPQTLERPAATTVAPAPAESAEHVEPSRLERIVTFLAVVLPFAGIVTAIVLSWGRGITWTELVVLGVMYSLTGVGVTVGFHRLFTHRSFDTVRPVKFILAVLGSMSVQGPLLKWVAVHRRHHAHSDHAEDPHSPHHHGGGVKGVLLGFLHAHVGWMFMPEYANLSRYVRDLHADRLLRAVSNLFGVWVLLGLLIPAAIGGWWTGTWTGALLGFLWGGLARVFLVHHLTWSINSVCHLWGTRPFESKDESRNNFLLGVLAFGEGWHNNHHAFPGSARHGLRWWELDISYLVIELLKLLGLAWRVRVPAPEMLAIKRVRAGDR